MKKIFTVFIILLLTISVQAQNTNFDKKLAKKLNKQVETETGIYNNDKMNAYLDSIGQRLVAQLDNKLFDYKFKLVLDESPNAFALPDGYIYVTSGMIPIIQNEDELACILGHEITHSNNRHSVKKLKLKIPFVVLEIPGILVGLVDRFAGGILEAPVKITDAYVSASYSRKLETEADDQGVILAAKAGYDPNALPIVLTRLVSTIESMTGSMEKKSFLNDHPYTPDRNDNIYRQLKNIEIKKSAPISNNLLNEFDGILFGESVTKGVIKENVYLHPVLDFYVKFPENWVINNQANFIIAHDTIKKSALKLSVEGSTLSPKQAGEKYIKSLTKEYRDILTDSTDFEQNGEKGYIIRFTENIDEGVLNAFVLWMPLNDVVYRFTGFSYKENHDDVENITKSLRALTVEDKNSIMQKQISIVKSKGNEDIVELSKRTGNLLDHKLTAIINSIDINEKIDKGIQIKIVVEKPYFK